MGGAVFVASTNSSQDDTVRPFIPAAILAHLPSSKEVVLDFFSKRKSSPQNDESPAKTGFKYYLETIKKKGGGTKWKWIKTMTSIVKNDTDGWPRVDGRLIAVKSAGPPLSDRIRLRHRFIQFTSTPIPRFRIKDRWRAFCFVSNFLDCSRMLADSLAIFFWHLRGPTLIFQVASYLLPNERLDFFWKSSQLQNCPWFRLRIPPTFPDSWLDYWFTEYRPHFPFSTTWISPFHLIIAKEKCSDFTPFFFIENNSSSVKILICALVRD